MTTVQESLARAAYGLFALHQPISLSEISAAAPLGGFPLAATRTPEWFAAAASQESSILDTAPELLILPVGDDGPRVDVSGIDLIHVYAPELQAVEGLVEPTPAPASPPPRSAEPVEKPRTSTQIGLLKELSNLDA
jgi:hypothetical protein